jgi:hypothetical protein
MVDSLAQTTSIRESARSTVALHGMVLALATGALLGALVAMPYEQVLGLSGPAVAILRSAVATAVLSGLCTVRPSDLAFDPARLCAHSLPGEPGRAVERPQSVTA